MKVTYNWLKSYTDFDLTPEELADSLTMLGLEVESLQPVSWDFDGIIIGKVTQKFVHENEERLSVCEVDIGSKTLNIVCGAPNVEVGQKVPVAIEGTRLPNGTVIKHTKIRGVDSQGMICSEAELGISSRSDGIMVLDDKVEFGQKLRDALEDGDSVIDIDVTPNRPDCFGIIGIARDISALSRSTLKKPALDFSENGRSISDLIKINILNPEKCPRYAARFVGDVEVKPSPWWLVQKLEAIGIRSINNIVDVTNYVMMETGQPLHAFDYALIRGQEINVKTAAKGEKFTTLDDVTHTLNSECLMICDREDAVAIGGVMGGLNSEVSDSTKNILLEAAYFDPVNIRRTSKLIGCSTEASRRFERGVDPNGTLFALDRAAQLIAEVSGGKIATGCIDVYPTPIRPKMVELRSERVKHLLGVAVPSAEIKSILGRLGFKVSGEEIFQVEVPTFRPDVTREVDLIEEVARLFGYDNIPADTTALIEQAVSKSTHEQCTTKITSTLISFGFSETVTYNLISKKEAEVFSSNRPTAQVINPLSEDLSNLRPSLIPGLLKTVQWNINRQNSNLKLFEIGSVFRKTGKNIEERTSIAGILTGYSVENAWNIKARNSDIYDLKGYVQELLARMGILNWYFDTHTSDFTNKQSISVKKNNDLLGFLGEVKTVVLEQFGIEQPLFAFNFDLEKLATGQLQRAFSPVPKFPPIKRDVAIVVDEKMPAQSLLDEIKEKGGEFLKNTKVFDIFQGESIGAEKKSLAFNLTFYSLERTLTEEEVESQMKQILEALEAKFSAKLRS
ncbi:MAG: phenylalanine--tRNA ligase subunit beta [Caldithrix sp.]|nr:MAG: phenylalanine--tRNA ligase subunit beta [Caldithrix sp.]